MKTLISTASACSLLLIFSGSLIADNAPAPSVVGGRKIFIDPATGQKTSTPQPAAVPRLPATVTNRVSTSSHGLSETPIATKVGGFKVNLGGRFHTTLVATNRPDGRSAVYCSSRTEQIVENALGSTKKTLDEHREGR